MTIFSIESLCDFLTNNIIKKDKQNTKDKEKENFNQTQNNNDLYDRIDDDKKDELRGYAVEIVQDEFENEMIDIDVLHKKLQTFLNTYQLLYKWDIINNEDYYLYRNISADLCPEVEELRNKLKQEFTERINLKIPELYDEYLINN